MVVLVSFGEVVGCVVGVVVEVLPLEVDGDVGAVCVLEGCCSGTVMLTSGAAGVGTGDVLCSGTGIGTGTSLVLSIIVVCWWIQRFCTD